MSHFRETPRRRIIKLRLEWLRFWSSYSEKDGIVVTSVICCGCGSQFEERLEEAKSKVRNGANFYCIKCDEEAESRDIVVLYSWCDHKADFQRLGRRRRACLHCIPHH